MITNPSVFDSSQNRGVLIPVCSRSESETFRESWVISRRAEVCQQSEAGKIRPLFWLRSIPPECAGRNPEQARRSAGLPTACYLTMTMLVLAGPNVSTS
ncbi:hypothetical protein FJ546_23385 [Mesorhizobium sp. B2-4-19]|nr:hypothetical protein FJ546_23385 [Mesorhizobium sp. B2-4-19]